MSDFGLRYLLNYFQIWRQHFLPKKSLLLLFPQKGGALRQSQATAGIKCESEKVPATLIPGLEE